MRKNGETTKSRNLIPFAFFLHCMVGLIVCLSCSLVFSVLFLAETLPSSSIGVASGVSTLIGSCVAGVLSSRKFGKPLITALAQGILYFAVLYILGAFLYARLVPDELSLLVPISCFSGATAGAIISALFKRKKR